MILIDFRLCGLRCRRARLFGEMEHRLLSIQLLLISVAVIKGNPVPMFRQTILGLSEDPQWLVENAPAVRLARQRATAKARAQMESEYRENITRAWDRVRTTEHRLSELQNEVYALRRVIKGMQSDSEAPTT